MKIVYLLLWLPFGLLAQNATPKRLVDDFFTAFHQKDTTALKEFFHSNARLESISTKQNETKIQTETVAQFLQNISKIPNEITFQEKLLDYKIDADQLMATVWTPYEFYVNDKKSHYGNNLFVLVKEKEIWKIWYLVDTRLK
jgi:ketosteroid isomerase-like protein